MKQHGYIGVLLFIILGCVIPHQAAATPYKYIATDSLLAQIKKHYKSSPDLALDYAAALQKEAENNKNKALEAKALWSIALINYEQGNLNASVEAYFKVIPLYKNLEKKKYVADSYYNIGKILTDTKNDLMAEEFYKKALSLYTVLNNGKWLANTNLQLGKTYVNLKQPEKATKHLNMALRLASAHNQKIIHKIYNWKGVLAIDKGNYEEAIALFNTSLAHSEQANDLSEKAATLLNIAIVHSKKGNVAAASKYAKQALALSAEINDVDKQIKPQILLAEIAAVQRGENSKEVTNLMAAVRTYENNHYNAYLQEALYYVSEKPQQDIMGMEDLKEMMRIQAKQSKVSSALYEKTKKLLNQHSIQLSIEKVQHEQKVAALKEKNDVLKWGSAIGLMLLLFVLIGYAQYVKHKKQLQQAALNLAETQLKETENRIESVLHENRKIKLSKESIYNELNEHVAKNVMLAERSKTLTAQIENYGDEYEKLNNRLTSSKNMMHEMSAYVWNMIKEVSRQGFKIPPPPPWDMGGERDN